MIEKLKEMKANEEIKMNDLRNTMNRNLKMNI